jgi:hypothetical protein
MKMRQIVLIALISGGPLCSQVNPMGQSAVELRQWQDRYQLQQWESGQRGRIEQETAQRREAWLRQWQFTNLMQRFLARWNDLAREYNSRGAVNPKKFKAASKAFHDLERSEGWMAPK